MRGMGAVALKELRQLGRDLRTLAVIVVLPLFFLWLYGYALNFDIRNVALAVQDDDKTPLSRELVAAFVNSGYFNQVASIRSEGEIEALLDRDLARAVLVVPRGFAEAAREGRRAPVQVIVAGDNANTATTVVGYARAILDSAGARLAANGNRQAARPLIQLEPRVWYNPELESTLFLVPGLIAYIAMITGVVSTALGIVREKERGTYEQIRMAPLATTSFVVGKSLPYLALSMLSGVLVLTAGMLAFDVPMRGSWTLLLVATLLFLVCAIGMGLLISTIADTQQVAFQIALLASFLPTFILSGFIFPLSSMPVAVQAVSFIVPARYYLVALRGVVLKGVGWDVLAPQLAALAVFAVFVMAVSAVRLARERA